MKKNYYCAECGRKLNKDEVALNKKLISLELTSFQCLMCLSVDMGCEVEDLETKIEEFKEQGCSLFV